MIAFAPGRILDIHEFAPGGLPRPNRGARAVHSGEDILVGLAYLTADGTIRQRHQFTGLSMANNNRELVSA